MQCDMKQYNNTSHVKDLCKKLFEFQQSSRFTCDLCFLLDDGTEVPVHSVVFAAASSVLHDMILTHQHQCSSNSGKLNLGGITAEALESLIKYIYTGELYITETTVGDILRKCSEWNLMFVQSKCHHFLNKHRKTRHIRVAKILTCSASDVFGTENNLKVTIARDALSVLNHDAVNINSSLPTAAASSATEALDITSTSLSQNRLTHPERQTDCEKLVKEEPLLPDCDSYHSEEDGQKDISNGDLNKTKEMNSYVFSGKSTMESFENLKGHFQMKIFRKRKHSEACGSNYARTSIKRSEEIDQRTSGTTPKIDNGVLNSSVKPDLENFDDVSLRNKVQSGGFATAGEIISKNAEDVAETEGRWSRSRDKNLEENINLDYIQPVSDNRSQEEKVIRLQRNDKKLPDEHGNEDDEPPGRKTQNNSSRQRPCRSVSPDAVSRGERRFRFTCLKCNRKFKHQASMVQHTSWCGDKSRQRAIQNHGHLFQCTDCDFRSTAGRAGLEEHMFKKHNKPIESQKLIVCSVNGCDYQTLRPKLLTMHMNRHKNEKLFMCDECGARLKSRAILARHLKMHNTNGRPSFKCDECDNSFSSNTSLELHVRRVHQKQLNFLCTKCPYRAFSKDTLRSHLFSLHNITSPSQEIFKCDHCDWKTLIRAHLTRHLRRHKGDKTFECSTCHRRFVDSTELNGHEKRHLKDSPRIPCTFVGCKHSEYTKHKLNEHIRMAHTHKGEKPWQCQLCDHRTALKGNLTKHLRFVHKVEVDTKSRKLAQINDDNLTASANENLPAAGEKCDTSLLRTNLSQCPDVDSRDNIKQEDQQLLSVCGKKNASTVEDPVLEFPPVYAAVPVYASQALTSDMFPIVSGSSANSASLFGVQLTPVASASTGQIIEVKPLDCFAYGINPAV